MEKIVIRISASKDLFCANDENGLGLFAAGKTIKLAKENISEAIAYMKEDAEYPEVLNHDYSVEYIFDARSILARYNGIFSKRGLSRITDINEDLLYQYESGLKNPRATNRKKIESALHELGRELIEVEL